MKCWTGSTGACARADGGLPWPPAPASSPRTHPPARMWTGFALGGLFVYGSLLGVGCLLTGRPGVGIAPPGRVHGGRGPDRASGTPRHLAARQRKPVASTRKSRRHHHQPTPTGPPSARRRWCSAGVLMKIVLVGAGSREFGPASIRDIILSDPLCDWRHRDRPGRHRRVRPPPHAGLRRGHRGTPPPHGHHLHTPPTSPTALPGADAVIVAIEINRYFYWAQDFHVPRAFGFRQIYGENGGPGGLFHALRNMGPTVDIARAMEAHCPNAWLVNYTNPLTKLCEAASTPHRHPCRRTLPRRLPRYRTDGADPRPASRAASTRVPAD